MSAQQFILITDWTFDAPLDRVWALIERTEDWPGWWPAVKSVTKLHDGDEQGVGAVRHIEWRTALPYEIAFDVEARRIEPMRLIEGRARGELDGVGLWTFEGNETRTDVRYDWRIDVTKPWMRTLAPLLRPVFAWNHNKVMNWGETGARKRLAGEI
jgi:uncharacterized protein YndB with AHSA1/START domain